jgi:hypothetical protein
VCPEPWKGANRGSGEGITHTILCIFDKINTIIRPYHKKIEIYFKNIVSRGALYISLEDFLAKPDL